MTTFESIFTAAASLPVEERVRLIGELEATQPPILPPELQAEFDRRWQA